ncbi:hypothetical protein DTL42_13385 [Bremerella cremea]|uniref:Uncharacterized protein n=1 Tax=Bremerella cremea TaxID=1031537 RepID=A0A368KU01_9BACT|nr:hypothetical protein [Bremerella cremea]RCS48312.1 hypothetical protein DTL42_13385 [Bremerella cremea]
MTKVGLVFVLLMFGVVVSQAQEPSKEVPRCELSGKIQVDGKPLAEGRILFYSQDNQIQG